MSTEVYGVMAEFTSEEEYLGALKRVRATGYRRLDTFTPYRVEGEDELRTEPPSPIPWIMFSAGLLGGAGAFFLQWYACRDYPLNVGGRPIFSWPSYIPITFELTVLTAALVGTASMLWIAGLPRLDHPVFSDPRFRRASQDRFFICIRADDPQFTGNSPGEAFAGIHAESVGRVLR